MNKRTKILSGLGLSLLSLTCQQLSAQGVPPDVGGSLAPADGTIWITETVNPVFVTIANGADFQNLTVTGIFEPDVVVNFNDAGAAPDTTGGDFVFSAEITTPDVGRVATPFQLTVTINGEWQEPANPDDPNAEPVDPVPVTMELSATYTVVPRPLNDDFLEGLKIPNLGGVALSTNNWASLEPLEPLHGELETVSSSVWWNWSPNADSDTLIDLSGSSFDPVLAVYTGINLESLELVASAIDDPVNSNLKANVTIQAKKGVTYRIAVSGQDPSGEGDIRLRVLPGASVDLQGPQVTILQPATQSKFNEPIIRIQGLAKDPHPDGIGVREIFATVNGAAPVLMTGTLQWSGDLTLESGTNIIEVYGIDHAGNQGQVDTIVAILQIPKNDHFEDAEVLLEVAGNVTESNEEATIEENEPFHAENDGGRSIWYQFTAPSNGELSLSTEGSDFDTLLAVYSGTDLAELVAVAFNDDANADEETFYSELVAPLVEGETYHIAVDGFGGDFGEIALQYIFVTKEVFFGLQIANVMEGTASPADQLFLAGSLVEITATPYPGYGFVRWEGSLESTVNPLQLEMVENIGLTPVFEQMSVTDDFESGFLKSDIWDFTNSKWTVAASGSPEHGFAAKSGFVLDGGSASLVIEKEFLKGLVAFDYKVSSEPTWDRLEFYVDSNRVARWSGETGWRHFVWPIEAGSHLLEWRYSKDNNFSEGSDLAMIDNVLIPIENNPEPARVSIASVEGLALQLEIQGLPGSLFTIQSTEDFSTWVNLTTVQTDDTGMVQWEDPDYSSESVSAARFYRVLSE